MEEIEQTQQKQGQQIAVIIKHFIEVPAKPKRPFGFVPPGGQKKS